MKDFYNVFLKHYWIIQLREQMKPNKIRAWDLMYKIGRENYPQEDVDMAWHLQKKYENVNTIAPDSCFHVAYEGVHEEDVTGYNGDIKEKKGSPKMVKNILTSRLMAQ